MIEVRNLHKELGEFSLHGVDLRVESGEYFAVLGPTGSGKTVLLECIAGIHRPEHGEVWLGDREVTRLAPEARRVGYVPQDYVLFPHMSLRKNLEFSLRLHRWPSERIDKRVSELAELLGIDHLYDRRPATLSGGEQQRSALARALAPSPLVLLLDEPLSALDEGTRTSLMPQLERVRRELGTTVIHVTHSFDEAMELADRVAIMRSGRIEQIGPPAHVMRRPESEFLARFMGCPNLFPAQPGRDGLRVVAGDGVNLRTDQPLPTATPLMVAIRPEDVLLSPAAAPAPDEMNAVEGAIADVQDRGRTIRVTLSGPLGLIVSATPQAFLQTGLREGDPVLACFPLSSAHVLPAGQPDEVSS